VGSNRGMLRAARAAGALRAPHAESCRGGSRKWRGPVEGLAILEGLEPPSWLAGSYMWMAVLADLHRRCGNDELAQRYRDAALGSAPSTAVRGVLKRRLQTSPA